MKQTLLNDLELSLFCENLSMMLGAGIPSSEALELFCEDMEPGPFQEGVRRVLYCLEETHSLPGALRAAGSSRGSPGASSRCRRCPSCASARPRR